MDYFHRGWMLKAPTLKCRSEDLRGVLLASASQGTFQGFWSYYFQIITHLKKISCAVEHRSLTWMRTNNKINSNTMSDDWISLNIQQQFNGRNDHIQIYNISNYKVGRNLLCNRFKSLNNKIKFTWFNDSFNTFKVKCKQLLLQ